MRSKFDSVIAQKTGYEIIFSFIIMKDPITALTWGHSDCKLFVAASQQLYTVSVDCGIPSLQSLCQRAISNALQHRDKSFDLVLPTRIKVGLAESFTSVIKVNNYNSANVMIVLAKLVMWANRGLCYTAYFLY